MKKTLLAVPVVLALSPAVAKAQSCVQADLNHPLSVSLSWQDNSNNETGFVLERKLNGGSYAALASGVGANITAYTDTTVVRSTVPNVYTYRVKAMNGSLSSLYSGEACITFAATPTVPAAPSNLQVSSVGKTTISLKWKDRSNNEIGFQAQTNGEAKNEFPINATSGTVTNLQPNTVYKLAVVALGEGGSSGLSNQVRVKTKK